MARRHLDTSLRGASNTMDRVLNEILKKFIPTISVNV